jgi:hypothetical protein
MEELSRVKILPTGCVHDPLLGPDGRISLSEQSRRDCVMVVVGLVCV